jgi:hypothetical protein
MKYPKNADYVLTAQSMFNDEGTLEVDDNAKVSIGDKAEGGYVQAWVWVSREDCLETCARVREARAGLIPEENAPKAR